MDMGSESRVESEQEPSKFSRLYSKNSKTCLESSKAFAASIDNKDIRHWSTFPTQALEFLKANTMVQMLSGEALIDILGTIRTRREAKLPIPEIKQLLNDLNTPESLKSIDKEEQQNEYFNSSVEQFPLLLIQPELLELRLSLFAFSFVPNEINYNYTTRLNGFLITLKVSQHYQNLFNEAKEMVKAILRNRKNGFLQEYLNYSIQFRNLQKKSGFTVPEHAPTQEHVLQILMEGIESAQPIFQPLNDIHGFTFENKIYFNVRSLSSKKPSPQMDKSFMVLTLLHELVHYLIGSLKLVQQNCYSYEGSQSIQFENKYRQGLVINKISIPLPLATSICEQESKLQEFIKAVKNQNCRKHLLPTWRRAFLSIIEQLEKNLHYNWACLKMLEQSPFSEDSCLGRVLNFIIKREKDPQQKQQLQKLKFHCGCLERMFDNKFQQIKFIIEESQNFSFLENDEQSQEVVPEPTIKIQDFLSQEVLNLLFITQKSTYKFTQYEKDSTFLSSHEKLFLAARNLEKIIPESKKYVDYCSRLLLREKHKDLGEIISSRLFPKMPSEPQPKMIWSKDFDLLLRLQNSQSEESRQCRINFCLSRPPGNYNGPRRIINKDPEKVKKYTEARGPIRTIESASGCILVPRRRNQ